MFKDAIEKVARFTRPVHSIVRCYGSEKVIPASATLFFINEEGYAITCKHVVAILMEAAKKNKNYTTFCEERKALIAGQDYETRLSSLEQRYKYNSATIVQVKYSFMDCVEGMSGFTTHIHPEYDLAILKFNDYKSLRYQQHAVFKKNSKEVQQGEFLCRLGFPFPEFSNFIYNKAIDDIEWTREGITGSPRFPLEGMITRFLRDQHRIYGIELSTPGLRGQSGGPLFNKNGTIYGMQFSTKHLHLGFDMVNKEIMLNNQATTVSDYAFIHLGQCIHADVIKDFLKEKNVKFYEE